LPAARRAIRFPTRLTADVYAHVGQAAHREAADTMQAALED